MGRVYVWVFAVVRHCRPCGLVVRGRGLKPSQAGSGPLDARGGEGVGGGAFGFGFGLGLGL
eukprot:6670323-Prymnesium_polylepis.1